MERERQHQAVSVAPAGGPEGDQDIDAARQKLAGLLQIADQVMDSIQPVGAEEYLQQSRQRSAQ